MQTTGENETLINNQSEKGSGISKPLLVCILVIVCVGSVGIGLLCYFFFNLTTITNCGVSNQIIPISILNMMPNLTLSDYYTFVIIYPDHFGFTEPDSRRYSVTKKFWIPPNTKHVLLSAIKLDEKTQEQHALIHSSNLYVDTKCELSVNVHWWGSAWKLLFIASF